MKQLIRQKVFETNSSSSHSISIADSSKEFVLDMIYPDEFGVITLTGGQFGWEWIKHNDALTKANYVAASYGLTQNLEEVLKEQTGAESVIYLGTDDYNSPNWTYVDHDSQGVAPESREDIRNFIFNKNSWFFGGNDNEEPDPRFFDVPEFREDKKIEPIYTHRLRVGTLLNTIEFKEQPTEDQISHAIYVLLQRTFLNDRGEFLDAEDGDYFNVNGKYFEYTSIYGPAIDFEKGLIYFFKDFFKVMKKEGKKEDRYEDSKLLKERLIKENSKYVKAINFYVETIQ